jgi:hypothetical protein
LQPADFLPEIGYPFSLGVEFVVEAMECLVHLVKSSSCVFLGLDKKLTRLGELALGVFLGLGELALGVFPGLGKKLTRLGELALGVFPGLDKKLARLGELVLGVLGVFPGLGKKLTRLASLASTRSWRDSANRRRVSSPALLSCRCVSAFISSNRRSM